mgnify:CR=1 FL=1
MPCSFVSLVFDHDLEHKGLNKGFGVVDVKVLGELLVVGHSEVSVSLVDAVEDAQTDSFELVEVKVLVGREVSVQVQNLFDENHEVVDVQHHYVRHREHYRRVEQLKQVHQHVGSLLVEVLEEFGCQTQQRNYAFVAEVVQFDFLGH